MSNERPWLDHYPAGVPAQINIDDYASVAAVIDEAFTNFADRPAFTNFGKTLSYREIDESSRQFAGYLTGVLKLGKGDRIAIMLPNVLQYPIALFGALRAGLVVVNTNPMYTARELRHQLEDSGAKAILVLDNFAATLQEVLAQTHVQHVVTTGLGDLLGTKGVLINFALKHIKKMVPAFNIPHAVRFRDALVQGNAHPLKPVQLSHDDIAFLQYTGGTTGVAKGAMLTHGNMVANMLQAGAWFSAKIRPGEEIIITALPLYHIFALTCNCFIFLRFGGQSILVTNPRDMPAFVKELASVKFTSITGVNTLFNGLLNTPGFDRVDFSHLRMSFGGGMAVQRTVAEKWQKVTGCALVEGYGMTESSPVATINPLVDGARFSGSIGLPIPSTEIGIQDDDGKPLAMGEVGEICIRGPQVMKGYWEQPGETTKVLSSDGWLRTGDLGRIDETGLVYIVDRKKDMIISGGFNVYSAEVEAAIMALPQVHECAVIGIPHAKWGEAVKALVVLRTGQSLTEQEILDHCRIKLGGVKSPKSVDFATEIAKTPAGKIDRKLLRKPYWSATDRAVH